MLTVCSEYSIQCVCTYPVRLQRIIASSSEPAYSSSNSFRCCTCSNTQLRSHWASTYHDYLQCWQCFLLFAAYSNIYIYECN